MPSTAPRVLTEVSEERSALDAFLSVDPDRPRQTAQLHIRRLETTITVQELDEVEISEILERFEANPTTGEIPARRSSEANSALLAAALVDPDLTNEKVLEKFDQRFGTGPSAAAIVRAVLKPLEIGQAVRQVLTLSGGGEDAVAVVRS